MLSHVVDISASGEKVILLSPPEPSDWTKSLEATFRERHYEIEWTTLSNAPPPSGVIISLLDCDGPFLEQMAEDSFCSVRDYFIGCKACWVIWVTLSSQLQCRDPYYSLTLGCWRGIRSKHMLDISTLEVDQFDSVVSNAVAIIHKKNAIFLKPE